MKRTPLDIYVMYGYDKTRAVSKKEKDILLAQYEALLLTSPTKAELAGMVDSRP